MTYVMDEIAVILFSYIAFESELVVLLPGQVIL